MSTFRNACAYRRRQSGVTLIEVLVTVAVTSVGLLGMGGLMIASARFNHSAYLQTQVNLAAQSLIESMHVNVAAVRDGRYSGTFAGNSSESVDCGARGCSADERAAYDLHRLDRALSVSLPRASADLSCVTESAVGPASVYNGMCRLQISWAEPAAGIGTGAAEQSQVWMFQP